MTWNKDFDIKCNKYEFSNLMYDDLTFLKDKRPNSEGKIPIYEVNNTQETKDFVISEDETYDIEGQINDKMEKMSDNPTDPGDKVANLKPFITILN